MWYERVNSAPTLFKAYSTFEFALEYTLPTLPAELHHIDEQYLGRFSAHIWNVLHIMKYTRPDLMYAVKYLSSCDDDPYEPEFQGIKHLIQYLSGCPYSPIMYPYGLGGTTTHGLNKEVSRANSTPRRYTMA